MRVLPFRSRCGGPGAALVAAAILLALGCPSPAHALTVGFLDPTLQTQDNARFWSDMTTLRAGVVRYDVYWNEIAPARPARPRDPASAEYRWEVLDRLVVDAAAHSTEIVLTLWRTPRWARADGGRGGKPNLYSWAPRISDWRAFVYAAAVRYSGSFDADGLGYGGPLPRVRFWEVWNEPNYIGALRPQRKAGRPVSPTTYTALLNAAYAELGRVERERRVNLDVLGGSMNRGFAGPGSVAPLVFLRGLKKAGARFDIASLHPYPLTGRVGFADGTRAPNVTLANIGDYLRELDRLWPTKRYRVWLTEYGIQSKPDRYGATLAGQAAFVRAALGKVKRTPRISTLIWFLIRDEPVEPRGQSDRWQSGLRLLAGGAKPAYGAWLANAPRRATLGAPLKASVPIAADRMDRAPTPPPAPPPVIQPAGDLAGYVSG